MAKTVVRVYTHACDLINKKIIAENISLNYGVYVANQLLI